MSSTTCIELSSEDECEIIGISTQVIKNEAPPKHSQNVKKLSRNSNIELTINLEDISNEPSEGPAINDKSILNKSSNSHLSNENGHTKEKALASERKLLNVANEKQIFEATIKKRIMPDIVIIDDDCPSKDQKVPQVNGLKSFFGYQHLLQHTRNSPKKEENRFSPASKPKSKEIVDSDVVVIDDDDDDETQGVKPPQPAKTINKSNNPHSNSVSLRFKEKIMKEIREKMVSNLNINKLETVRLENVNSKQSLERQNGRSSVGKRKSCTETVPVIPDYPDSESRITRGFLSSLNNPSQNHRTSSKPKKNEPGTSNIVNQPMNKYSIENMFSGLVTICNKIFTDDKLETKLWNSFRQASEDVLRSEEFINALKVALNTSEKSKIETLDEKLAVSRDVKEVIRILKRNPVVVDKKVKKLTKMLTIIRGRIKKLEETEVTSDEDGEENAYVLLDRYRARASKIFDKICELQGESSHAGRAVRQRFSFTGNSGYPKIEQALQKYYLKTKMFPDFFDVKKLVESTVKKENLDLPPGKIHTTAQSIFLEFGNRLQRMRCFDEYSIMNEYLEDGKTKDPALDNEQLHKDLAQWDSTKRIHEGERKILEEFSTKQIEQKSKEDNKSGESDNEGSEKDNDASDEEVDNPDSQRELHLSDTDEELINSDVKNKPVQSEDEDEEPPLKIVKL